MTQQTPIYNIYEAKAKLSHLIALAQSGQDVIIGRAGTPVAKLTATTKLLKPRKPGLLKGKIKFSKDYNQADKEIEEMFYNSALSS